MVRQMRSGEVICPPTICGCYLASMHAQVVDRVTVRWSSGKKQTQEQIAANQYVKIEERDLP